MIDPEKTQKYLQAIGEELKRKCEEEKSELIEKIVEKVEVDRKTYITQLVDECLYKVNVEVMVSIHRGTIEDKFEGAKRKALEVLEKKLHRDTRLYL